MPKGSLSLSEDSAISVGGDPRHHSRCRGRSRALDAARQGGTVNLGYVFKNPPPGSYDGVRGAGSGMPRPTSFTPVRGLTEAARAAIVGRWAAQYEARAYKYELLANGRSLRYDFCWLEERMVPLGFRLIHLCRMPESFASARAERLKVSTGSKPVRASPEDILPISRGERVSEGIRHPQAGYCGHVEEKHCRENDHHEIQGRHPFATEPAHRACSVAQEQR